MSEPITEIIIEDLTVGEGDECQPGGTVNVHYKGELMDGTVFDSSHGGASINFPLGNLIQVGKKVSRGMKVGGKRKLTIPFMKAYGEAGAGGAIPPRADLIFEIDLLGVS